MIVGGLLAGSLGFAEALFALRALLGVPLGAREMGVGNYRAETAQRILCLDAACTLDSPR